MRLTDRDREDWMIDYRQTVISKEQNFSGKLLTREVLLFGNYSAFDEWPDGLLESQLLPVFSFFALVCRHTNDY